MLQVQQFNNKPDFRFGKIEPLILDRQAMPQSSGLGDMNNIFQMNQTNDLLEKYPQENIIPGADFKNINNNKYTEVSYNNKNTGASDGYFDTLGMKESSNNYNAVNSLGYTGKYQFGKNTAAPFLAKRGKTWDQFKNTPSLQEAIARDFTEQNSRSLKNYGLPVNDFTLWVAHNQGAKGASDMLKHGKINVKNVAGNLPKGMEPTAQNYIAHWSKEFPGSYDNSIFASKSNENAARLAYEAEERKNNQV